MEPILYDYWRSSASYRVRIALSHAGISHETVPVDLLTRSHKSADHLARNPQGLVPAFAIDGQMFSQSLAIIEYLNETHADGLFLPADPIGRQRVRALSYAIAMEIHPVCNMGVVAHVAELTGGGDAVRKAWMQKFISEGLTVFEQLLDHPSTGIYCQGDRVSMADFCLVPQVYNARRWEADISSLKRVNEISSRLEALPSFQTAVPEAVKP